MKIEAKKDGMLVTVALESETERVQFAHALTAVAVSSERGRKYSDGWRRKGALGNVFQAKDKVNRVWDMSRHGTHFDIDDAYDVINYLIFGIRAQEESNHGGEFWPEKDQRTASPQPVSGQDREAPGAIPTHPASSAWQSPPDEVR